MKEIFWVLLGLVWSGAMHGQQVDPAVYSLDIDFNTLVNRSHAERTVILTPFYEWGMRELDSITIFQKIDEIARIAEAAQDRNLAFEVKLLTIHYYAYRSVYHPEPYLPLLSALDSLAKAEQVWWLEIRTQNMLGNFRFINQKQYERGFEHYERTAYLLDNVSPDSFPLKQECLFQIGDAYGHFKDHRRVVHYLTETLRAYRKRENDFFYRATLNRLGLSYRALGEMDSSSYYFERLRTYSVEMNHPTWEGVGAGALGYNFYLEGRLEQAIPLLELQLQRAEEIIPEMIKPDLTMSNEALISLSEVYQSLGSYDTARAYISEIACHAPTDLKLEQRIRMHRVQAHLAAMEGKGLLAMQYQDSAFRTADSMAQVTNVLKLARAREKVLIEQQHSKVEQVRAAQARQLWVRNGVIIGLVFLVIITLLLVRQSRLKIKHKEAAHASLKASASKELAHFRSSLMEKNAMIESVQKKLDETNRQIAEENSTQEAVLKAETQQQIIEQLQEATLLTDRDWREFKEMFEHVHQRFFARLDEKWPGLTPSEVRFMALSRLQLENKEMALMLGVSTDAIRQVKRRIRKKLNLDTTVGFEKLTAEV